MTEFATKGWKKTTLKFFWNIWKNNCSRVQVQSGLAYWRQVWHIGDSCQWGDGWRGDDISGLMSMPRDAVLNICCNNGYRMFSINIFVLNSWTFHDCCSFLLSCYSNAWARFFDAQYTVTFYWCWSITPPSNVCCVSVEAAGMLEVRWQVKRGCPSTVRWSTHSRRLWSADVWAVAKRFVLCCIVQFLYSRVLKFNGIMFQ